MSKCTCLSAPDYHRTDCEVFDERGNFKNSFKLAEYIAILYLTLQKKVSHLVILKDDEGYYVLENTDKKTSVFDTVVAAFASPAKYNSTYRSFVCSFDQDHSTEALARISRCGIAYKIYRYDAKSRQLVQI